MHKRISEEEKRTVQMKIMMLFVLSFTICMCTELFYWINLYCFHVKLIVIVLFFCDVTDRSSFRKEREYVTGWFRGFSPDPSIFRKPNQSHNMNRNQRFLLFLFVFVCQSGERKFFFDLEN